MDVLPPENETKQQLYALLREQMPSLHRLRDARRAAQVLADSELLEAADVENVSVDTGAVCYVLTFPARAVLQHHQRAGGRFPAQ